MPTDIEIARAAHKRPIAEVAARLGLSDTEYLPYGHDKAKITHQAVAARRDAARGRQCRLVQCRMVPATLDSGSDSAFTASENSRWVSVYWASEGASPAASSCTAAISS